jgi:mannose-6-phosphate isomerase
MLGPLRFQPFLRPLVWGGRRLGEVLHKPLPNADAYGESWEISDHPSHRTVVASGPHTGRSLRDLMERNAADLFGDAPPPPVFPWLVKYLDARDWLSVQVHPDDERAARLCPGEGGKTEAWFVLDAAPDSRIYAGLRPGIDEARMRAALREGHVADCLHQIRPQPGQCLFLPAGTVHAVGGGVLIAEVQQTSDATFRLFDWNRRDGQGRSRPLHIEQALACIDWQAGPITPVMADSFPGGGDLRQRLVSCSYFTLDYVHTTRPLSLARRRALQVVLIIDGQGRIDGDEVRRGDTLLLPARTSTVSCETSSGLGMLVTSLP